jgi:hypothetical protein
MYLGIVYCVITNSYFITQLKCFTLYRRYDIYKNADTILSTKSVKDNRLRNVIFDLTVSLKENVPTIKR